MKRRKHAGKLRQVLIASALMLLLMSCRTVPPPPAIEIAIDWPAFPDPRGVVALSPDETIVAMPIEYWMAVAEYVISVREARGRIEAAEGGPIIVKGE